MNQVKQFIPALVILSVVCIIGYSFYQAYLPQPIRLQGQMEAQQYSVSSKIAGRIDQVLVKKGQQIIKGDHIFTIFSPEIDAKLDQAVANRAGAIAMAEQAENGTRDQQIYAAKDQWQKAKAATQLMKKTFERINNLYNDGVIAEQKKDEAYTQWQVAKYTEQGAFQLYGLAKEGARNEMKVAAAEKVKMADGAVAEVQAYAKETNIVSRFEGEVSQVLLHSGELAPQGFPVVTIIDMQDAWAVFNVREDHLMNFRKGTKFNAYLPALDENLEFEVTYVAVQGDFATWRSTDASQGFDMRTFEVEARPVKASDKFRIGMSLVVEL